MYCLRNSKNTHMHICKEGISVGISQINSKQGKSFILIL